MKGVWYRYSGKKGVETQHVWEHVEERVSRNEEQSLTIGYMRNIYISLWLASNLSRNCDGKEGERGRGVWGNEGRNL